MPGTSHELEASLLNELPVKSFDVVRTIINFYPLDKVISLMKSGVSDDLKAEYPRITSYEWEYLTKKICLTRLTAIRVNSHYPEKEVRFLLNIALECMECNNCSKKSALSKVRSNQRHLALWLATCFKIINDKEVKARRAG